MWVMTRLETCPTLFHRFSRVARDMNDSSENQPRRNEECEGIFCSFFVSFVSSWLIFIVSGSRLPRHERLLGKSSTKKRRARRYFLLFLRFLRIFVVDFHCFW